MRSSNYLARSFPLFFHPASSAVRITHTTPPAPISAIAPNVSSCVHISVGIIHSKRDYTRRCRVIIKKKRDVDFPRTYIAYIKYSCRAEKEKEQEEEVEVQGEKREKHRPPAQQQQQLDIFSPASNSVARASADPCAVPAALLRRRAPVSLSAVASAPRRPAPLGALCSPDRHFALEHSASHRNTSNLRTPQLLATSDLLPRQPGKFHYSREKLIQPRESRGRVLGPWPGRLSLARRPPGLRYIPIYIILIEPRERERREPR